MEEERKRGERGSTSGHTKADLNNFGQPPSGRN